LFTVKTGEVYVCLLPVMEIYTPKCSYFVSLFKLPLFKWDLSENLHFDSIDVWLNTRSCWQCHTSKAMCYFFLHKCEGWHAYEQIGKFIFATAHYKYINLSCLFGFCVGSNIRVVKPNCDQSLVCCSNIGSRSYAMLIPGKLTCMSCEVKN